MPNRIVTGIGIILLIFAAVFYFLHIADNAVIPLLILGVIVSVIGLATGR